jgi:hypothetical protein
MKITLTFERNWDETIWKTRPIHPKGMPAVLLTWQPDPWPVDGGIPGQLIEPLARALGGIGPLVFCLLWPIETTAPTLQALPRPARSTAQAVFDAFTRRVLPPLALATDEAGAAELLAQGWANESQLGFLLAPGAIPDPVLLATLLRRPSRQGFTLPPVVQALIAPPSDGDGVFIAARNEIAITQIQTSLTEHLVKAGFAVGPAA